jgi:MFS family permease
VSSASRAADGRAPAGGERGDGPGRRGPAGRGFHRANARWLVGGLLLFLLSSFGQTFFVSLFADGVRADAGLSLGEFAGLYTAATLCAAVGLAVAGPGADRVPPRFAVPGAVTLLALGCLLMAVRPQGPGLLFVALLLLRLAGQGMLTHLGFTLVGRWFTAERGRAVSATSVGLNLGEALLPLAAVPLAAEIGRRGVWATAVAVLVTLGGAATLLLARERIPAPGERAAPLSRPGTAADPTRREVLRTASFYLVLPAMAAPALIGNTVFFHQSHLADLRDWPLTAVASAYSVYAVSTVVFNFAGGHLLDRTGALALVPCFLIPLATGLWLLGTLEQQAALYAFMALYGVTNGVSLSLFGAVWPELYGVTHLGAIRSAVVAVLVVASAVGPGAVGVLLDLGAGLPALLWTMGAYCLAASVTAGVVIRRRDATTTSRRRPRGGSLSAGRRRGR